MLSIKSYSDWFRCQSGVFIAEPCRDDECSDATVGIETFIVSDLDAVNGGEHRVDGTSDFFFIPDLVAAMRHDSPFGFDPELQTRNTDRIVCTPDSIRKKFILVNTPNSRGLLFAFKYILSSFVIMFFICI